MTQVGTSAATENPGGSTAPRPPLATPFFYGWVVVAVSMGLAFLGAPAGQIFMAIMLKPMSEELGWTRSATAGAITVGTVAAGLLSPLAGALADRFGPRLLAPLAASAVVLALFVLAGTQALWQFYLGYSVCRALSSTCLNGVVPMTTATNWFRTKRGRAMGFMGMAFPLGGSAMTFAGQVIMEQAGWRAVFVVLGSALALLGILPSFLLLRRRPEEVGLHQDGDPEPVAGPGTATRARGTQERSFTLQQAVRTRALWLIIAAQVATTIPSAALSYHMIAYFTDHGIAPAIAAGALSAYALFGAISAGLWGFLSERISERILAAGAMSLAAASTLLMAQVRLELLVIPAGALLGLAARGEGALLNMIVARYFGRDSYGKISGMMQPFNLAGLGSGPLLASLAYDASGSYDSTFVAAAALFSAGVLFISQARPPGASKPAPSEA